MRFRVTSTNWIGGEEILKHYPCLKKYNLEDPHKDNSDVYYRPLWITINSMEELFELMSEVGEEIILADNTPMYDDVDRLEYSLEIYDGYRE